MNRRRWSVLVGLLAASVIAPGPPARARVRPCSDGRYFVAGAAILPNGDAALPDSIRLSGRLVGIDSGCAPAKARVRATRNGTRLRVRWGTCKGITGPAKLSASVTDECLLLTGRFKARKANLTVPVVATLSRCGDGVIDAEKGETCDGALDAGCPGACVECRCPLATTTTVVSLPTTTSASTSSSTSVTAPTSTTTVSTTTGTTAAATTSTSTVPTTTQPTTSTTTTTATTTSIATTSTTVTTTTSTTHTTTTTAATSTTVPTTTTTRPTTSTTTTTATTTSIATTSTTVTTTTSTTHTTTTSATTSTTVPGTPDLVPTDFTGPATGAAGGQITVSFTVKNQGTASASPTWTDQLVFSSDTAIGGDTVLSNVAHTTAVAANATYSASRTPTLPNVPPGTYYLLLRVDLLNQVAEGAGESNNVAAAIPIVVQTPDLVPTALTAADGDAGHAIAVSFTVKNQGDVSASPNWVDQLWLSTDQAFGGDTQLATVSHTTALAPDATYDVTRNPTLPEVPPGTYYVLLRTDSTGQVYEGGADANNDAAPVAITIHTPDLVPTEIDAPATATHGTQITITFTVENQGAATADPNWNDQLWLSTDQTLGGDTLLTNSAHTTGLSAGASYGTVKMPTLPNVTGSYYLLVHTDSADQVYEGGADGNNVLAVPITIQ